MLPNLRIPAFGPAHIAMAVAALLLALFAYATVQTAAQTFRLREARRALQTEIADLRYQRAELEGIRAYIQSEEYVEGTARERFGLVRPGEVAVIVYAPAGVEPEREPGERWWKALFGR